MGVNTKKPAFVRRFFVLAYDLQLHRIEHILLHQPARDIASVDCPPADAGKPVIIHQCVFRGYAARVVKPDDMLHSSLGVVEERSLCLLVILYLHAVIYRKLHCLVKPDAPRRRATHERKRPVIAVIGYSHQYLFGRYLSHRVIQHTPYLVYR